VAEPLSAPGACGAEVSLLGLPASAANKGVTGAASALAGGRTGVVSAEVSLRVLPASATTGGVACPASALAGGKAGAVSGVAGGRAGAASALAGGRAAAVSGVASGRAASSAVGGTTGPASGVTGGKAGPASGVAGGKAGPASGVAGGKAGPASGVAGGATGSTAGVKNVVPLAAVSVPDGPTIEGRTLSQLAAASTAMSGNRVRKMRGIDIVYLRAAENSSALKLFHSGRRMHAVFARNVRLSLRNYCVTPAIDAN
jgi:hypothetical protein